MIKSFLTYALSTLLAAGLLYWAINRSDLRWNDIYLTFQQANYMWVGISVAIALASHIFRALRWEQLLGALQYYPGTTRTLAAVLIGYFANFLVPRMGEVTRCGSLQKTADIPFEKSFGTVITERIVDLLGLLVLVGLTFLIEWEPIQKFLFPNLQLPSALTLAGLASGAIALLAILWVKKTKLIAYWLHFTSHSKLGKKIKGWVLGIASIREVQHPRKFLLYTFAIWFAYFANTYALFLAFPSSAHLGFSAALTVLVMGTFGMATPTQGGIGAYHSLVASALGFYLIQKKEAMLLATFFHGTQMALILLLGGLSFLLTLFLQKRHANTNE
jgi:uncharacterized protein (TIRG00374 family)